MATHIYEAYKNRRMEFLFTYFALKVAPYFFFVFLVISYFSMTLFNISCLLVFLILSLLRYFVLSDYLFMKSIIELEIGQRQIRLITQRGDYILDFDKIQKLALKQNLKKDDQDIFIKYNQDENIDWPSKLFESSYLKIPMIFDTSAIDILNDHPELKNKCANFQN